MRKPRFDYLACQRHILLDMHVPDWDPGFLAKFDSQAMAALYQRAGADAVMHYCNSHVGLNYWPSAVGAMHGGLAGRDMVGDTVSALHQRGIASCAYYSSYFHNWAWTHHPDWRIVNAVGAGSGSKYGVCCPSNRDYHAFQLTQVAELASAYPFDAFFFDMVFWTEVCVCDSCRARFRAEAEADLPTTVDWASPMWRRFVAARERWLAEAFSELRAVIKAVADIPVFSNITPLDKNWPLGVGPATVAAQDLIGGDFGVFGNDVYVASHVGAALTPGVLQYMNAFTGYIGGASFLIDDEEQFTQHALASLLFGGQFMAIDAVESDGAVNPAFYETTLTRVFDRMKPFEACRGGRPIADVGVYFSFASRMSLDETGTEIGRARVWEPQGHMRGVQAAVRALQRRQIPAAVVTERDLADLSRYRVIVLPNVVQMSRAEAAAFADYVAGGGKLYASANTSRLSAEDGLTQDFALADLFGCAFEAVEHRPVSYLRPKGPELAAAIAPRTVVAHGSPRFPTAPPGPAIVRFRPHAGAEVLATLDLPFGQGRATRETQAWSSIHAAPPYIATSQPVIVRNRHGAGEVIYCGADIEADVRPPIANEMNSDSGPGQLFIGLIELLLGAAPLMFRIEADSGVLAVAFDDPARRRLHIANMPPAGPVRPVPRIGIAIGAPAGRTITGLRRLPSGEAVAFELDDAGVAHAATEGLEDFAVLAVDHH